MVNTQKAVSKKTTKKTTKKATKTKVNTKRKKSSKPLKPYCGIAAEIPKTHRMGTMKECLELGQVRQYGLKKIDTRLAESVNKKYSINELMTKLTVLKVKIMKAKQNVKNIQKEDEKKKIMTEINEMINLHTVLTKQYNSIKKKK